MRSVDFDFIERPSPNFDERQLPVSMIVLHYTGMPDCEGALDRLTSPEAKVSCPLSGRRGRHRSTGWSMKASAPGTRASRAGAGSATSIRPASGSRSSIPATNSAIVEFPDEQIASVIPLVADIKERHGIGRGNVVGHSDIAPTRKEDPGELFPWAALAKRRLALPSPTRDLIDPYWTDAGFLLALERFGYDVTDAQKAVIAFQRRVPARPHRRDHRRRMPGEAARVAAAAAAVIAVLAAFRAGECSRMFVVTSA